MQRQEGAKHRAADDTSAWHDEGLCAAQACIATEMIVRGNTQKLLAEHQLLRQAAVNPEGYRTFATCHVRLLPKPNSRPSTLNSLPTLQHRRTTRISGLYEHPWSTLGGCLFS